MNDETSRNDLISVRITLLGFLMSCVIAIYHVCCRCYSLLWILACSALLYFGLKRISPRHLSLLTGGR